MPYSQLKVPTTPINPHTRPYYLKSRTGCLPCKQRKVKCDEKQPLCNNCAKRFPGLLNCNLLPQDSKLKDLLTNTKQLKALQSSSSPFSIVTYRQNHIHESIAARDQEDRLMYHYAEALQKSLPDHEDQSGRRVWEFDIPQLASSDLNVRGAVLSISAIHLRALLPDDVILSGAPGYYFAKTISTHRENMAHLDTSQAETLIITALILIYYTWQASLGDAKVSQTYSLPLQTFHMEKGFFALIARLSAGGVGLGKHCQWLLDQTFPPLVDESAMSTRFFESFRESLKRILRHMPDNLDPIDQADFRERVAFCTAICYELTIGVPQTRVRRALVMTVSHCSSRYIQLLQNNDPIALSLFAHALALVHVTDHVWWLHGPKELHLERYHIRGIFGLMPRESLWMMQWPLDVVEGRQLLEIKAIESPKS